MPSNPHALPKAGRAPTHAETSRHVRAAVGGDVQGVDWIVRRFSPLLQAQADMLLGRKLRRLYDPADLVADVWAVALPRLRGLPARSGRFTPVLMKFLATTLRFVMSNILQKHGRRQSKEVTVSEFDDSGVREPLDDETSGIVTAAVHAEDHRALIAAISKLGEELRSIVLLRGFEQLPYEEIANQLGLLPNTVSVKYRRALEKLRGLLPGSIFDEFPS